MPRHPPYTLNTLTTFALDTHGLIWPIQFSKNNFPDSSQEKFGGAERDRTADPLLAKQALSQLSYSPIFGSLPFHKTGSHDEPFRLSDGGPR